MIGGEDACKARIARRVGAPLQDPLYTNTANIGGDSEKTNHKPKERWQERCVVGAGHPYGARVPAFRPWPFWYTLAGCLLEAGKCQLRGGECKRAQGLFTSATLLFTAVQQQQQHGDAGSPSHEVDGVDARELQEPMVKADRLAGAAGLQGRDVDVGKKLLIGALDSARRLHFRAEEARCLRLLANLQSGEPHLKSLQGAVDGFSLCNLPYEHAEALLCLATLKTFKYGDDAGNNHGSFRVLPSGDMRREFIVSAKQDLEAAAGLLQPTLTSKDSKHDHREAKHAQSLPVTPDASATKRPRARLYVEECGTLCNSSIALELLGRIYKACARACILIGEFEDARTYLTHALNNREWVKVRLFWLELFLPAWKEVQKIDGRYCSQNPFCCGLDSLSV